MKHTNIKKIAVIVAVIVVFGGYILHQRTNTSESLGKGGQPMASPNNSQSSSPSASNQPTSSPSNIIYKDGTYTGDETDAYYGYIKVKATIAGGKLTDVAFLEYPNDRINSVVINQYAMPQLKQQAIKAQSATVDGVSGATDTSQAFIDSLDSALRQAKAS